MFVFLITCNFPDTPCRHTLKYILLTDIICQGTYEVQVPVAILYLQSILTSDTKRSTKSFPFHSHCSLMFSFWEVFFCQLQRWLSCGDYHSRSALCKICDHLAPHCEFMCPLGRDVLDSGSLVLTCSYRSPNGTTSIIPCSHVDL